MSIEDFPIRPIPPPQDVVFTVLDASGEVLRVITTHDLEQLAVNVPAGGSSVVGVPPTVSPTDSYRVGGTWMAKPAQPSAFHQWDPVAKGWNETRTLAELKLARWGDMKAERERRMALPMVTSLGPFDATAADQDNLNKVISLLQLSIAAGGSNSANYTLADNTRPTFTLPQLQQAALEIGAQVQALYDTGNTLRQAIEASTTAAQVAAITWS
jgi:hypothetical protein